MAPKENAVRNLFYRVPCVLSMGCQKRNSLSLFVPPFIQSYFLRKIQPDFENFFDFSEIFFKILSLPSSSTGSRGAPALLQVRQGELLSAKKAV